MNSLSIASPRGSIMFRNCIQSKNKPMLHQKAPLNVRFYTSYDMNDTVTKSSYGMIF